MVKFEISAVDLVRIILIKFNSTIINELMNLFMLNRKSGHCALAKLATLLATVSLSTSSPPPPPPPPRSCLASGKRALRGSPWHQSRRRRDCATGTQLSGMIRGQAHALRSHPVDKRACAQLCCSQTLSVLRSSTNHTGSGIWARALWAKPRCLPVQPLGQSFSYLWLPKGSRNEADSGWPLALLPLMQCNM